MAIIKAIQSGASIKRLIDYVTRNDDLDISLMDGIDCNPQTVCYEMLYTRDKFSKYDGVQYIHMVYSLSPSESENVEMEQIISNAKKLIQQTENFSGHQILICGHNDKRHKHAHIVVNSINYKTGKKVRWYRTDLARLKENVIILSKEQGLETPVKGDGNSLGGNNVKLYKSVERAFNKDYDSWMLQIYENIISVKEVAISKEDFIAGLAENGIKTKWDNRQTIMFQDGQGHKVRNSRLADIFKLDLSKETLENEFATTKQLFEAEGKFKGSFTGAEGSVPEADGRELCLELSTIDDEIKAAIDAISIAGTNEQDSAAKRDYQITQRRNREIERERHHSAEKQVIRKTNIRIRKRNRSHYFER